MKSISKKIAVAILVSGMMLIFGLSFNSVAAQQMSIAQFVQLLVTLGIVSQQNATAAILAGTSATSTTSISTTPASNPSTVSLPPTIDFSGTWQCTNYLAKGGTSDETITYSQSGSTITGQSGQFKINGIVDGGLLSSIWMSPTRTLSDVAAITVNSSTYISRWSYNTSPLDMNSEVCRRVSGDTTPLPAQATQNLTGSYQCSVHFGDGTRGGYSVSFQQSGSAVTGSSGNWTIAGSSSTDGTYTNTWTKGAIFEKEMILMNYNGAGYVSLWGENTGRSGIDICKRTTVTPVTVSSTPVTPTPVSYIPVTPTSTSSNSTVPTYAGACGVTPNTCNVGISIDVTDSASQYLWNCVGTASTANCSKNITPTVATSTVVVTPTPTLATPMAGTWDCKNAWGTFTATFQQNGTVVTGMGGVSGFTITGNIYGNSFVNKWVNANEIQTDVGIISADGTTYDSSWTSSSGKSGNDSCTKRQ